jgi:putative oxidoreductase
MGAGLLLLLARILLAAMFLSSGYSALSDIEGTAGYFAGLGLGPAALLAWGVGVFELAAGVLLVIGFQTRAVAIVLALFTLAATYLGHYGEGGGDPAAAFVHMQALLKDIAVAGGMILLALHGPGRLSVDGWRSEVDAEDVA